MRHLKPLAFQPSNWRTRIEQIIHPPSFLSSYERWWSLTRPLSSVEDFEFAILILRICSYTCTFLPSRSQKIEELAVQHIKEVCDSKASQLVSICNRLDFRGSLLRVQHLIFMGLIQLAEGRMDGFWEAIGHAIKVAQRLGIHRNFSNVDTRNGQQSNEMEKEMSRRVCCNLYVWDR